MNAPTIKVEGSGVKLGWSTLVIMIVLLLGFYAASVLNPINSTLAIHAEEIVELQGTDDVLEKTLLTHLREDAVSNAKLEGSLNTLNVRLQALTTELKGMRGR